RVKSTIAVRYPALLIFSISPPAHSSTSSGCGPNARTSTGSGRSLFVMGGKDTGAPGTRGAGARSPRSGSVRAHDLMPACERVERREARAQAGEAEAGDEGDGREDALLRLALGAQERRRATEAREIAAALLLEDLAPVLLGGLQRLLGVAGG